MLSAYKPNSNCTKVISRFYENIMECKGKSTLFVKSKWEDELNVEISVCNSTYLHKVTPMEGIQLEKSDLIFYYA